MKPKYQKTKRTTIKTKKFETKEIKNQNDRKEHIK